MIIDKKAKYKYNLYFIFKLKFNNIKYIMNNNKAVLSPENNIEINAKIYTTARLKNFIFL